MYPQQIQCTEGKHPGIDVKVRELTSVSSVEPSLFDPPIGAKELADCSGRMQAPKVLQAPDPKYAEGANPPTSPEVLQVIVGRDGNRAI